MSDGLLETCPKCGCRDLFIRKNFPQRIGLAIVALAGSIFIVLAAWRQTFWIGAMVLLGAAIIDAVLYAFVPKITVCYRCRAEFHGPINPVHHGFELAVGEKYRSPR
ncbi:MAG TPA: hypothetical protein VHD56_13605 [Tepidisphaeraceae bacterium]|nr:hypothetical protein [Tepidisphaeraceae bacterium]